MSGRMFGARLLSSLSSVFVFSSFFVRRMIVSFLFPLCLHSAELTTPSSRVSHLFPLCEVCGTPVGVCRDRCLRIPSFFTCHSWTLFWEEVAGHSSSQERKQRFPILCTAQSQTCFLWRFSLFFEGLMHAEPFMSLRAEVRTFVIARLIYFRALPAQRK